MSNIIYTDEDIKLYQDDIIDYIFGDDYRFKFNCWSNIKYTNNDIAFLREKLIKYKIVGCRYGDIVKPNTGGSYEDNRENTIYITYINIHGDVYSMNERYSCY